MKNVVSVITESKEDVAAMKAAIGQKDKLRFWACDGRVGLAILARNVAVHEKTPVIVICDETYDAAMLHELVGNMSGTDRCQVIKKEDNEQFYREIIRAANRLAKRE